MLGIVFVQKVPSFSLLELKMGFVELLVTRVILPEISRITQSVERTGSDHVATLPTDFPRVYIRRNDSLARITENVIHGCQYFFASSNPDSPLAFSSEELRNLYRLREGDAFNADKIRGSLDAYRQLYGARGYIDFSSVPEFDVDDKTRRVNLRIVMDQQKQFRIDKVDVSGLDSRTEGLLRSRVKSGDIFNSDLIHQFFEENQSVLPPDASPRENLSVEKNVKAASASLRFDFFTCPNPAN